MNFEKIMQALHEIFDPSLPQLAPGDTASTRRALEILYGPGLEGAGEGFEALDIGCGNGRQTLRLAAELNCPVLATDNWQPYLDELERRAAEQGVDHLVRTHCEDMAKLDFGGRTFDLVWAEGSAFVVGIREALDAWRKFVKPGGALGFTELTWFESGAPDECRDFIQGEYPPMTDEAANLAMLEEFGWEPVGHFRLPESAWTEKFHGPLEKRLETFEASEDGPEYQAMLRMASEEGPNYRKYSRWYGYTFFLARFRG